MKTHIIALMTFLMVGQAFSWYVFRPHDVQPEPKSPPTYHEMFRPSYHFSCPENWMNDPVGLVYAYGMYHMYYQYNPYSNIWGNMTWGHATSTDLVHWDNMPVAIEMYDDIMIFSGSNIIDVNNTSGLCEKPGCLIAYYTAHDSADMESQAMAYSNDNGTSYQQFYGNPIINLGLSTTFRDPKVFWYAAESKWVMVTAQPMSYILILYYSYDLVEWIQLSVFGPEGSEAGGWEDPDLYEIAIDDQGNTRWILAHSVAVDSVEYYIGEFNGVKFTNTETKGETLFYDYGFDFDEAATWNNEPKGRRLIIAWLDEGAYGGSLPTKAWRGQLTLIREITVKQFPEGLRVVTNPIPEYEILRNTHYHYDNLALNSSSSNVSLGFNGTQLEIIAVFEIPDHDVPKEFGIQVLTGENQTTIIGYNTTDGVIFIDRTNSGLMNFSTDFLSVCNTTLKPENGTIQLRIFVDHSSVEVFANNGRIAMTSLVFPDPTQDAVIAYAIGGSITLTSIDAWALNDIWPNSTTIHPERKEGEDPFKTVFDKFGDILQ